MSFSLRLENIFFRYNDGTLSDKWILNNINFSIDNQGCTALVGPSGAGKTTLVQLFTGLLKPSRGTVFVNHKNIWAKSFSRSRLFKDIGLVFQFPESQLFEETVADDVAYGPKNLGLSNTEINRRVRDSLNMMGIDPQRFTQRSPFQLSEGEKRRVAIAGILAMQPNMIVFDEPTAGLDPAGVRQFAALVHHLLDTGIRILVISHNMDFVAQVADRVVVLKNGSVLFDGGCVELFDNPELLQSADLEPPAIQKAILKLGVKLSVKPASVLTIDDLKQILEHEQGTFDPDADDSRV